MDTIEALEAEKRYIENFLNDGDQRLKAWYVDGYEAPSGYEDFDRPPHQLIMERAIEMISIEIISDDRLLTFDNIGQEAKTVLAVVGLERLMTGIHLVIDQEKFVDSLDNSGKTPHYLDSVGLLREYLQDILPHEDIEFLRVVCRTAWVIRNNIAHFGFHRTDYFGFENHIMQIARKLFLHFSDRHVEEIDALEEQIENTPEGPVHNIEFEFDPEDRLHPS